MHNKIEDIAEANEIINSIKIWDPAVGSGHFLVSALNEIIAIKSELRILLDRDKLRLRNHTVEVVNDDLMVQEEGELFEYNPQNPESQRVQEALFHEKQSIIENCLFGVDINPNSVKICQLRLWIQLLKHSYYLPESNYSQLETLPNIDINIKCGNSLVSRFQLGSSIKQALRSSKKWTIDIYRVAVDGYRNAKSKEEKREMEKLIADIKGNFATAVNIFGPERKAINRLNKELESFIKIDDLFTRSAKEKQEINKKIGKIVEKIKKKEKEIEDIERNVIFRNAFEWRFEFPEILNDDGDYVGFDAVIGNPPYGIKFDATEKKALSASYATMDDIFTMFIEKAFQLAPIGYSAYICPIYWPSGDGYLATRTHVLENSNLDIGVTLPYDIFEDAYVDTGIYIFSRSKGKRKSKVFEFEPRDKVDIDILKSLEYSEVTSTTWKTAPGCKIIFNEIIRSLNNKFSCHKETIADITKSTRGILAKKTDYASQPLTEEYKKIFLGKMHRYVLEEDTPSFVKYGENLKEKPKAYDFFGGERVLVRRIVSRQFRVMATFTNSEFVNKKDIYMFKSTDPDFLAGYLTAILNSKLISFMLTRGSNAARKDDFTQLTLSDVRQIRIPKMSLEIQRQLSQHVKGLIAAYRRNETANIYELERIINQQVYEIYSLKKAEIEEVETAYPGPI
ncbi:MAG: N-6 DNA methylase [Proteobacteria bacterium]|nr:N-6 DNA methylase [Pseudomonadota bacterium]